MIPRRVARRTARRTTRRVARRQGAMAPNSYEETEEAAPSTTDELERLFQLKQQGAITEEEYEQKKKDLL